jgi:anaerobic ribonucleoside-triphosphate reductase
MIMDDINALIEKVRELIRENYKEYKVTITGVHIEKIAGKDEYVVTVNFNALKKTEDGIVVIEQKLVFSNNIMKFTTPYKYIL